MNMLVLVLLAAAMSGLALVSGYDADGPQQAHAIAELVAKGSIGDDGNRSLDDPRQMDVYESGEETHLVVASRRDNGFQIVNVTDPANLQPLGSFRDANRDTVNRPYGIDVFEIGTARYVILTSFTGSDINIFNITNPSSPSRIGGLEDGGNTLLRYALNPVTYHAGSGTYAIVTSGDLEYNPESTGIQIINLTNPASPRPVSNIPDTADTVLDGAEGIDIWSTDSKTYVAVTAAGTAAQRGIQIIDVTDPANPTPKGSIRHSGSNSVLPLLSIAKAVDVYYQDGTYYAAVASVSNAFQIIDLSDVDNPRARGALFSQTAHTSTYRTADPNTLININSVAVIEIGGRMYAVVGGNSTVTDRLALIDITNPDAPVVMDTLLDNSSLKLNQIDDIVAAKIGGKAFVFTSARSNDGVQAAEVKYIPISPTSTTEINSDTNFGPVLADADLFGTGVAGIGDLNSDGVLDVAAGAYGDNTGATDTGAVHVMLLLADGRLESTITINNSTANGPVLRSGDNFGNSVAGIGDINADGVPDIAAGAYQSDVGHNNAGEVHIMLMNADGSVKSSHAINSNTSGLTLSRSDNFGSGVAGIGDLDSDGTPDIAIGAYRDDAGSSDRGAVHIFLMNSDGTVKSTSEINSTTTNGPTLAGTDHFGISVAGIGDINNDGIPDIAVGAQGDDTGDGNNFGAVYVLFMNSDGTVKSTHKIDSTTENGPELDTQDLLGGSVAGPGDLDHDGTPDIVSGAYRDDAGGTDRGAVHIFLMNPDGTVKSTSEINDTTGNGPTLSNSDIFGSSVSGVGDLNSDGVSDIMVGAYQDDTGGGNRGAVHFITLHTDFKPPTLSSSAGKHGAFIRDGTAPFSISFDQPTTGFAMSDITVGGSANPGAVTDFAGDGRGPYTFTLTPANAGAISVDLAGGAPFPASLFPDTFTLLYYDSSTELPLIPTDSVADTSDLELDGASNSAVYESGGRINAIVASYIDDGIQILDISDPYNITAADSIDDADGSALKLDGANNVAVYDDLGRHYAAVTSIDEDSINIIDVSNPSNIISVGNVSHQTGVLLDGVRNIAIVEISGTQYAVAASPISDGIQVLRLAGGLALKTGNLADDNSRVLGQAWDVATVTINGTPYAAVTSFNDDGVQLVNLSNPASPTAAGSITDTNEVKRLLNGAFGIVVTEIAGKPYAAVSSRVDDGVQLVNLSNPASPTAAGSIRDSDQLTLDDPTYMAVARIDGRTYAIVSGADDNGVQILDITDPENPAAAGNITDDANTELERPLGVTATEIDGTPYVLVAGFVDDGVQMLGLNPHRMIPSITSTGALDGKTITSPVPFSITFNEAVTGFTSSDVMVSGTSSPGAVTDFAGSGAGPYTFTITPAGRGTITLDIGAGVTSPKNISAKYTVNYIADPTPTITSSVGDANSLTRTIPVPFSISFDWPVTNFAGTDIAVGGSAGATAVAGFTGSGKGPYNFNVTPNTDGDITINVSAGVTTPSNAAASTFTIRYSAPPIPTITMTAAKVGSTTGVSPVPFSVSFDKAVTGFTSSDVMVSGTSSPGAVTDFTGSGAGPYTFTIPPANDGTIILNISENAAVPSGETNPASAAAALTVTYSSPPAPAISSTAGTSGSTTGITTVPFSISFDKTVTGFTSSDVMVSGTSNPGAVTSFSGSGTGPYTFTIRPAQDGTIIVNVPAGRTIATTTTPSNAAATEFTITYSSLPVPSISSSAGTSTMTSPVPFSISFDKTVTGFTSSDVTVSGTSNPGDVTSFSGSGTGPYTFSITPSDAGTIVITVPAGGTSPANVAATFTVIYTTNPLPVISSDAGTSGSTTYGLPVPFSIMFDQAVSGFESTDITVGGTANPGPVTGFGGSGIGPYVFTIVPGMEGTITIDVPAGSATSVSNGSASIASSTFSIIYATPPAPGISSSVGASGSSTTTSPVPFSISFDKDVTGLAASDIAVGGTAGATSATGFDATASGTGPYTFSVMPANSGSITVSLPASATDPPNAASGEFTIIYLAPPVPTISSDVTSSGDAIFGSPVQFTVMFDRVVAGFTASDITVGGTADPGAITQFAGSGQGPYTFNVMPGRDGTISIEIPAGATTSTASTPTNVAASFTVSMNLTYLASDWSSRLNVADYAPTLFGCDEGLTQQSSHQRCSATMTEHQFILDGTKYAFSSIFLDTFGTDCPAHNPNCLDKDNDSTNNKRNLWIYFAPPIHDGIRDYTLSVGGLMINFADPAETTATRSGYMFHDVGNRTDPDFQPGTPSVCTPLQPGEDSKYCAGDPQRTIVLVDWNGGENVGLEFIENTVRSHVPAGPPDISEYDVRLTVKNTDLSNFGCDESTSDTAKKCSTLLTQNKFTYQDTEYTVTKVFINTDSNGKFVFRTSPALPTSATISHKLVVGASEFALSGTTQNGSHVWSGINHFLKWQDGQTVSVEIRERPPPPPTAPVTRAAELRLLTVSPSTVTEGSLPNATVTVRLAQPAPTGGATIGICYSPDDVSLFTTPSGRVLPGFALPDQDYMASHTSVTIPAGQRSASFDIVMIDDLVVEPVEKFRVSTCGQLPNEAFPASGAAVYQITGASVTIRDND